ncbi:hypothetical protein HY405_01365 [Candidatus Microgenomates bacterium]|nr:hypothetical protein [Candidatus Microgenomates bacterium]
MAVGDFRAPDLHYKGWLEKVQESDDLTIIKPAEGEVFFTNLGASKKEITVSGVIKNRKGKVLVIIRTDRDYPQALIPSKRDDTWNASGCTLGGVDHQIYAVLVDGKDTPLIRSTVVNVRLERR